MTHVRGTIHGKLIELSEETGLPDGQEVTVFLQPSAEIAETADLQPLPPGEGLRRAYGSWAEDAEGLEDYLHWNARQRELSRPELEL
jgi:hypothetical protein